MVTTYRGGDGFAKKVQENDEQMPGATWHLAGTADGVGRHMARKKR